jgi:hypothetical protein
METKAEPVYEYTTSTNGTSYVCFPLTEVKPGIKTFTIDMDKYDLDEGGIKAKGTVAVTFYKFRIIEK